MPPAEQATTPSQQDFQRALEGHLQAQETRLSTLSESDIRQGVPFEQLETLARTLDLTQETLTHILGTSERTLQRRKREGRLKPAESDRFGRLARVYERALRAFDGDQEEAHYWLTTPKRALGGEPPVEHLDTEPGTQAVLEMLVVIDQTIPA